MTNPYKVLGVSPDASADEIKKAYRTLSRKYHPDSHIGKPDAKEAEEKFKEVQQAYEDIINRTGEYFERGFAGFGGSTSAQGANTAADYNEMIKTVQNFINEGNYAEAWAVLNSVSYPDTAMMKFLRAQLYMASGSVYQAILYAREACEMEPDNEMFRNFLNQMQNAQKVYESKTTGYGQYSNPRGYGRDRSCCDGDCCSSCCSNLNCCELCCLCFLCNGY